MDDQELYDRLLGTLVSSSSIDTDGEPGVVTISVFEGLELDPAMRLHVDPQTVGRTVREIAASSYVQPGMDPVGSSIGLFLVHIWEAVHTARDGETELVVVSYGVESYRPDGTKTPFAPVVEEKFALDAYYERLIEHYADRGELTIGIGNDLLTLSDLDGHAFPTSLTLHVPIEDLRSLMREADDREAAWQAMVDEIDRLAGTIDTRSTRIAVTSTGVTTRALSDPLPERPAADLTWSARAPESGQTYRR
ncbi:hypothetical protein WCD74_03180 [Actinomycetospora sp. OC33-EN08]|uniref:Uncharacterized protein n=1 Tax=Actinomycetospora aurantiaca TaxID=3129233 RepID=A0ABU8MHF0_9PSEU